MRILGHNVKPDRRLAWHALDREAPCLGLIAAGFVVALLPFLSVYLPMARSGGMHRFSGSRDDAAGNFSGAVAEQVRGRPAAEEQRHRRPGHPPGPWP
ncbi:MAG: hypothetical protein ACREFS_13890, partial [Acetobacteraceae bacterium]